MCAVYTLTQVVQQLLGTVLSGFEVEEFLVLVDELRIHGGVEELVVGKNILKERDVGLEMERQMDKPRRRLLICCLSWTLYSKGSEKHLLHILK